MEKDWWKSTTLWGGIVMMGAFIASFAGITITSEQGAELTKAIVAVCEAVSVLVGLIMVIVGRIKAGREIKGLRMQVRRLSGQPHIDGDDLH